MKKLRLGILGLGLIGGSLARALRDRTADLAQEELCMEALCGFDLSPDSVSSALAEGVLDRALCLDARLPLEENKEAVQLLEELDLLFMSLPLEYMPALGRSVARVSSCLLSDVASVKLPVQQALQGLRYIGGHPMAGSERQGFQVSQAHLFEHAVFAFCPPEPALYPAGFVMEEDRALLFSLARALGAKPYSISAQRHDAAVATISHLPHVVASALSRVAAASPDESVALLAAGGFKDVTRIASSDAQLWSGITKANEAELLANIDAMIDELEAYRRVLLLSDEEGRRRYFMEARSFRDHLPERQAGALQAALRLTVDVQDQPGVLGRVTQLLGEHRINIKNINLEDARQYEGGVLRLYLDTPVDRERAKALLEAYHFTCAD